MLSRGSKGHFGPFQCRRRSPASVFHTRVRVRPAIVRLAGTCGGVKRLKNQFCWFLSEEMTHTHKVLLL